MGSTAIPARRKGSKVPTGTGRPVQAFRDDMPATARVILTSSATELANPLGSATCAYSVNLAAYQCNLKIPKGVSTALQLAISRGVPSRQRP